MPGFFSKITQKTSHYPMMTLAEIGLLGFFVPKSLLNVVREKKQLEQSNPGKNLTMKQVPGWLGFPRWSWAVEETRE